MNGKMIVAFRYRDCSEVYTEVDSWEYYDAVRKAEIMLGLTDENYCQAYIVDDIEVLTLKAIGFYST